MVIGFKQRKELLRELQSAEHAEKDFQLLKKKAPQHPLCSLSEKLIGRKSNEILYALIAVATKDEIVSYRNSDEQPSKEISDEKKETIDEKKEISDEKENELEETRQELEETRQQLEDEKKKK